MGQNGCDDKANESNQYKCLSSAKVLKVSLARVFKFAFCWSVGPLPQYPEPSELIYRLLPWNNPWWRRWSGLLQVVSGCYCIIWPRHPKPQTACLQCVIEYLWCLTAHCFTISIIGNLWQETRMATPSTSSTCFLNVCLCLNSWFMLICWYCACSKLGLSCQCLVLQAWLVKRIGSNRMAWPEKSNKEQQRDPHGTVRYCQMCI